jgi:arginyl-tRNA synthetase
MFLREHCLEALRRALAAVGGSTREIPLGRPDSDEHGDLATSIALKQAGELGTKPRALAERIVAHLSVDPDYVQRVDVAGPGFINFFAAPAYLSAISRRILCDGTAGLWSKPGGGLRAQVEFCSANPTGPLLVSHGRGLVLGDTIANILAAAGYDVTREYYYNDAGRQMRLLGDSVRARACELRGKPCDFPEDGYRGDYITEIAQKMVDATGDDPIPSADECARVAEETVFAWIRRTVASLGVAFDLFYNEKSLHEQGHVERVLRLLDAKGLTFLKDGAQWLKGEPLGLGDDRVLVKASGETTYRLPDLAYHLGKFERGFDLVVDVLGADHLDESQDVLAGLNALGGDADRVRVIIHQFVTLLRGSKQVKMSTRKAVFVTLDDLVSELGPDVVRYFFLTRSAGSHLPFDLDLATQQSDENPVFYLQYAHARIAGVVRHASAGGVTVERGEVGLDPLTTAEEVALMRVASRYPDVTEDLVSNLEPHRLVSYLAELASAFHLFYHRHRVLVPERSVAEARLALALVVQELIRDGLGILGVSAPDRM